MYSRSVIWPRKIIKNLSVYLHISLTSRSSPDYCFMSNFLIDLSNVFCCDSLLHIFIFSVYMHLFLCLARHFFIVLADACRVVTLLKSRLFCYSRSSTFLIYYRLVCRTNSALDGSMQWFSEKMVYMINVTPQVGFFKKKPMKRSAAV